MAKLATYNYSIATGKMCWSNQVASNNNLFAIKRAQSKPLRKMLTLFIADLGADDSWQRRAHICLPVYDESIKE